MEKLDQTEAPMSRDSLHCNCDFYTHTGPAAQATTLKVTRRHGMTALAPLEATYMQASAVFPTLLKALIEPTAHPPADPGHPS
jgi:hypothetical protein